MEAAKTEAKKTTLYPFHEANIHEQRFAAGIARCAPVTMLLAIVGTVSASIVYSVPLLLWCCAVLNVVIWIFLVSSSILVMIACKYYSVPFPRSILNLQDEIGSKEVVRAAASTRANLAEEAVDVEVHHLIVIPNYKEDLECLSQTLTSLQEADGSQKFVIALACEDREGDEVRTKVKSLQNQFQGKFHHLFATYHPGNLDQEHTDGSSNPEVAGKASNLRWAVDKCQHVCAKELRLDKDSVMLTILDSDVIFHPCYFSTLQEEVQKLRAKGGDSYKWTLWQAPQLQGRNFGTSYAPSRVWGYAQVVFEFGGVAGLKYGFHHMVFSSYSLPLALAHEGNLWDGDGLAEDHHAFLKAFFYSIWVQANAALSPSERVSVGMAQPLITVKGIILPSKSTAVEAADGWYENWCARWDQSKRHARGVSELCYFLLATYDLLSVLPFSLMNMGLFLSLARIFVHLVTLHVLIVAQGFALAILTLYWNLHHEHIPGCPFNIWFLNLQQATGTTDGTLLCGLAGAWSLMWPVVVPVFFTLLANYWTMSKYFVATSDPLTSHKRLATAKEKIPTWYREDGNISSSCGSRILGLRWRTFVDTIFLMSPVLFTFNFTAGVLALFKVTWMGNQFKYVTAARVTGPSYGATTSTASAGATT